MTSNIETTNPASDFSIRQWLNTDQIIFIVLVVFALIGVAITDMSPEASHGYWVMMTVVFGLAAVFCGWKHARSNDINFRRILSAQLIHWASTLPAVLIVYTLLHTGALAKEETGLVILLVLALATFLGGLHVGWRFYALGALLASTTIAAAYIEEFLWVIVLIALALVAGTFYWAKRNTAKQA